jgi:hypothetical protein
VTPQEPGTGFTVIGTDEVGEIITLHLDEMAVPGKTGDGKHSALRAFAAEVAAARGPVTPLPDPRRFTQYPSFEALAAAHRLTGEPHPDGGE